MKTFNSNNNFFKTINFTLILLFVGMINFSFAEDDVDDDEIKWDIYGSARITPEYWHRKKWYKKKPVLDANGIDSLDPISGEPLFDGVLEDTVPTNRFIMDLNYGSRFGVKGRTPHIGFQFELGWVRTVKEFDIFIQGTEANVDRKFRDGLRLRRLFGEWYINDMFSLLVGHEWTIANFFVSSQGFYHEMGLSHSGALFTGRRPQVKFTATNEKEEDARINWKAQLALVKPDTFIIDLSQTVPPNAEESRPKIEFGGNIGMDLPDVLPVDLGFNLQTVFGTHSYDVVIYPQSGNEAESETVESWVAGFNLSVDVWRFSFSGTYTMSQNIGSYGGVWIGNPEGSRLDEGISIFFPVVNVVEVYDPINQTWEPVYSDPPANTQQVTDIFNAKTNLMTFVASFKITDWLGIEAGGGWVDTDHGLHTITEKADVTLNALKRASYYVNLPVNLYNGKLLFSPEFSFSDFGGFDNAGKWYSTGAKLQIGL